MIIDAHCHAWEQWPYQPPVPDPQSRARVQRLLWEMDQAGVGRAILISAAIDGNPGNAQYTHTCATALPDRLLAFPDVDCRWHPTHQTPGADQRLRETVRRFNPAGFTFYLHEDRDPAWLLSADGLAFFGVADAAGLIVSLACGPRQLPTVCVLAQRYPATPFLLHHLGRVRSDPPDADGLRSLCDAALVQNVVVKLSGFGFAQPDGWNFPNTPTRSLAKTIYEHFGADRLCWGSDYPVSQQYMTYRQSLEVVRTHCAFMPEPDLQKVLGGTLQKLLDRHPERGDMHHLKTP